MAATTVNVQMQQRRDTAANWTSANPTLLSGELGWETDTLKAKLGDGSTAWTSLGYITGLSISAYPLATADIADDAVTADKLADTAVTAGSYTAADITVDAQGRITAAASGTIATSEIADDAVTAAKLADTAVTAGSYTAADITVDAQGRITAAASGTASSGGTYDFVASGAIANGDTVIVNTDGTVSVVGETGSADPNAGTPVVYESANSLYTAAVFDSSNNKVVIAYRDIGNSGYGTAIVGTVSGTSISFGTAVVFESASCEEISATFDSSNNKVVIAYADGGNSNYGTAIVGTVSGTSISFGTAVVFKSAYIDNTSATFDSTNGKVVIACRDTDNSNYGTAIVGTVSGTSISFGTAVIFHSAGSSNISATFDSTNGKVVIAYSDGGNASYGNGIVGTVSGTSISFGTAAVFESAFTGQISATFDSTNGKVVIAYRDSGNSSYGTAVVGTVSGTSISFGTPVVFESASVSGNKTTGVAYDSASEKVVIAYRDVGNSNYGTAVVGTVSGTSISFGTPLVFESASTDFYATTYDSANGKVVIAYRDIGNSSYGTAVVFSSTSLVTNLTAQNYIGIAAEAIADTATGSINIIGGVNEGQTGLTAAQTYYVQGDGSLSTTAGSPSVIAGTSISSTKIIVKG